MKLKNLKVSINGPMWVLDQFRVENIDLKASWKDDTTNGGGSVTVPEITVSPDSNLDIHISFNGPNHGKFKLNLTGKTDEIPMRKLEFTKEIVINKNGWIAITFSETIDNLINGLL